MHVAWRELLEGVVGNLVVERSAMNSQSSGALRTTTAYKPDDHIFPCTTLAFNTKFQFHLALVPTTRGECTSLYHRHH